MGLKQVYDQILTLDHVDKPFREGPPPHILRGRQVNVTSDHAIFVILAPHIALSIYKNLVATDIFGQSIF